MEIISIETAKQQNLKYYFTGKPCRNGHTDIRSVANRGCRTCNRDRVRKFEAARVGTTWRSDRWVKSTYNLTVEDHQQLLKKQNGACKTCYQVVSKLHIDHDHKTGKVRGLLCGPCNRALGMVKDNAQTLQTMIKYLQENAT